VKQFPNAVIQWPNTIAKGSVLLLRLQLKSTASNSIIDQNDYWLSDTAVIPQNYSFLGGLRTPPLLLTISITSVSGSNGIVSAKLTNTNQKVAFFIRLGVTNNTELISDKENRVLPVSYSANYFNLFPGESVTVTLEFNLKTTQNLYLKTSGWNVQPQFTPILQEPSIVIEGTDQE